MPALATTKKLIILADGENLVFRFQEMLSTRQVGQNVVHIPDLFVWNENVGFEREWHTMRVNYYMSAVAADDGIEEIESQISKQRVIRMGGPQGQICPRIFKKDSKSKKSRLVDISIAIDALRHSFQRDVDAVLLLSGDGDYLPLIKEIMRNGTQAWLGAFSSGLNPKLRSAVDHFIDLDWMFFKPI